MPQSTNQPKGKQGETIAANFLKQKGYHILATNFKARYGEIDIIAKIKDTLVFVEVKTRWSSEYGAPQEAVTYWKLRNVIKTAEFFKLLHPGLPDLMRIDVVAISLTGTNIDKIEHIENVSG